MSECKAIDFSGFVKVNDDNRPIEGTYIVVIRETKGDISDCCDKYMIGLAAFKDSKWIYSCGDDMAIMDDEVKCIEDSDDKEIIKEELYAYKPIGSEFLLYPEMYICE